MREEILVAPVAKYLPTGRCVIKGRYCDASANVGIRGCYPLSLINDDVLATQLQLPLRHLALSVFHPFGVLHRALPVSSLSLSLCPSLSGFAATLERSSSVEADARPATTSDLHHPLSSTIQPPSFWPTSCPPLHSRGSRDIQLSYISNDLQRALYPEFNSAQPAPTFSLPPLSPPPILLIGGPRDELSITFQKPKGEGVGA